MIGALSVSLEGKESGVAAAERSLRQQGFVCGDRIDFAGGTACQWAPAKGGAPGKTHIPHPTDEAGANLDLGIVRGARGDALCVGPIWYRGRFGPEALQRLLSETEPRGNDGAPSLDETQLRGNFALFLHRHGRAWLLNDALGFVRVYSSDDGCFHSTSWLAARAYTGSADINEAAAIEYVLLGAVHDDRTIAPGVTKLPLGHGLDLRTRRAWRRFQQDGEPDSPYRSIDEAVEGIGDYLLGVFREIAAAFPGRTSAALSGGFDSRLIVAGLLAQREQPRLFVYGAPDSEDVPIARQVAEAEGIPLTVFDKDLMNRELPVPDLVQLVGNALFFDGLPNDGIDDPGADRTTRLLQGAGDYLVLNGGGGEIFRNFFHLPNRRFRPIDIVRAFYRGFDPAVFRRAGGLADYQQSLARSIARSVGLPGADSDTSVRLTRSQTELVYPFFRCHHWMGLNNSAIVRHGFFGTPLVDLQTVRATAALPLAWKNAGLLESRLIARLHAGIASRPSSYGFRFSDGPDARARRSEWLTGLRPAFARPLINAARRRLQRVQVSPAYVARARAMLPGEWRLDPVLDLARLSENSAFARALSVEVVSRELAP
jgi:hypothetical protein